MILSKYSQRPSRTQSAKLGIDPKLTERDAQQGVQKATDPTFDGQGYDMSCWGNGYYCIRGEH